MRCVHRGQASSGLNLRRQGERGFNRFRLYLGNLLLIQAAMPLSASTLFWERISLKRFEANG